MLSDVTCRIRFLPSDRSVEIASGTTLLEAAQRAKLPVAEACGAEGICARCGMQILEGDDTLALEDDAERDAKQRNRVPQELRLACQVTPDQDLTVTAPYWTGT